MFVNWLRDTPILDCLMTDTPLPERSPDLVLHGSFHEEQECSMEHVPFELSDDVDQLLIDITYNDRIGSSPLVRGGNTLDIGLFDQQGIESGSPGFRGWSGSEQTRFVIGADWSTPPYRAGRPLAGTWHLLLGPYKIGPNGLDWTARIWLDPGIAVPEPEPIPELASLYRPHLPAPAEPNWYRGDLHMHTVYSDGSGTPAEVAVAAVEAGLDFFGITDHNRAQSPVGLVPQGDGWPVLVPGVEVTTYAGHFNVWGTDRWYDFREPTADGIQRAVDAALADGGTVSLNHPKPLGPEWEYPEVTGFHSIEAWNGWWAVFNAQSLAWWARQLGRPDSLPMIGGSDMHKHRSHGAPERPLEPARIAYPTTWVQVDDELTAESILASVRSGRTFLSESPSGPQLFEHSADEEIRLHIAHALGHALLLVGPHGVLRSAAIAGDDVEHCFATTDIRRELGTVEGTPWVRPEIHAVGGAVRALGQAIRL
jgi:hypothetical protein